MSLDYAKAVKRERFSETYNLYMHIKSQSTPPPAPSSEAEKSLKGLWLVKLYGSVEKSVNELTDAVLSELNQKKVKNREFLPSIHSIIYYDTLKSFRDSKGTKLIDKYVDLTKSTYSDHIAEISTSILSEHLQNIDFKSISWIINVLGADPISPDPAHIHRLNTLKERRNAVAHGRESAAQVGQGYTYDELNNVYRAADAIIESFSNTLYKYCTNQKYILT